VPLAVIGIIGCGALTVWSRVQRVDVPSVSAPTPVKVVALVGSDGRGDTPADDLPIFGTVDQVPGERADAVVLVSLSPGRPGGSLGLPRDLLVPNRSGEPERLSIRYERDGPSGLVQSLCEGIGVPVTGVVVVRFETVRSLVDAVDGVEVASDVPLRDRRLGFEISAGRNHLDGAAALSYVRARSLEVRQGTVWRPDAVRSAARSDRAAQVAAAVSSELASPGAFIDGLWAAWVVAPSVTVSSGMGPLDLYRMGSALRTGGPGGVVDLPVVARPGPVPAMMIDQESIAAIESFLGGPPGCQVGGDGS